MSTEEPVISTPPATPTGSDAFKAARASIAAQSTETPDQGPDEDEEKKPDDTSTEQPAEEPDEAADQPPEPAEPEDTILTPDELAKLSPKERANAEKWQAKLTQKSQALSAQAKEFETWKPLIDGLQANPDAVIEELAKRRGLTITKTNQDTTVAKTAANTIAQLPTELQFLQPVFEEFGKQLLANVDTRLQPIAQAQQQMLTDAAAAETDATIQSFTVKHPEWKKHETKMMELGQKFIPTTGNMTDLEYMEALYKLVTFDQHKADQTKKVVEKLNKVAETSETPTSGVPAERVVIAMPPPEKRSIRDAWKAAARGERWSKD